jgi:hypothetical protein
MAFISSSTRKGLGLKFEQGRPATFGLERMRLTGEAAPKEFLEHEDHIPFVNGRRIIQDQGATSTCVGQTFVAALHMAEMRQGLEFDPVSVLYPYYNSRRDHGGHLTDNGTYLHTLAHALRVQGACSEQYWKWSQLGLKVNRRPNWNAMRFAHPRRGGKYVRIYEAGEQRIDAIQQAILGGHNVAFGTRVGVSFLPARGADFIDALPITEKIAGNHAMLIIGWKTFGDALYFRVLNSWGSNWRNDGRCWMSADYLTQSYTNDLHVIYGWRRLGGS